jgi:chromosome segregation ATPase
LTAARRDIRRLEDQLADAKTREENLRRQIEELNRTVEELRAALERCKDYDDIKAALQRRTSELAAKTKECDELGDTIKDLRKELEREIEKNTALKMRVRGVAYVTDAAMRNDRQQATCQLEKQLVAVHTWGHVCTPGATAGAVYVTNEGYATIVTNQVPGGNRAEAARPHDGGGGGAGKAAQS